MLGLILIAQLAAGPCSDGLMTWPAGPDGRCHAVDRDRGRSVPNNGITNYWVQPTCAKGILVLTRRGAPMCAQGLTTPIMK